MASDPFRAPRGTRDLLPEESWLQRHIERVAERLTAAYAYREVRPPLLEETRLFSRSLGEQSDVVEKEMFTIPPRAEGSASHTLRPEGTAGVVRAYVQGGYAKRAPFQKWFYFGPMFRYERPQKGRERQFDQFGVEALGSDNPLLDAEVIDLACRFFEALGMTEGLEVRVNSMGDPEDRAAWRSILISHFEGQVAERCEECRRRYTRNVFRLLDCKNPRCVELSASAPPLLDSMSAPSRLHHEQVLGALQALGRKVQVDTSLVRGLDYYTRTVFEVHYPSLGARSALCGGGRYDGLVEEVGGPATPAIGFAVGITPTLIALEELGLPPEADVADLKTPGVDLYVVAVGEEERAQALQLASRLRASFDDGSVTIDLDLRGRSVKAQFKAADKARARAVLILGPEERAAGQAVLREMGSGTEERVDLDGSALEEAVAAALAP